MKFIFSVFLSLLFFTSCNQTTDYKKGYQDGYADGLKATESNNTVVVNPNPTSNNQDPNSNPTTQKNRDRNADGVPQQAITVLEYIKKNNAAPDGFVGGRHFGNYEHLLPERDAAGNRIKYQEWDVNADKPNKSRGEQRLVTGSDGRNWFTNNHYKSFTQIK